METQPDKEYRKSTQPLKVEKREDSEAAVIQGYAAVTEQETRIGGWWGSFREKIAKGAFKESIRSGRKIVSCFNHDMNQLLGSTTGETLRLKEDDTGLWIEVDPPDSEIGRSVTESIRRGDVDGQSIMFHITKETWDFDKDDPDNDLRTITEVELWEWGPVTFPAYEQTTVGLRSAGEAYKKAREEWLAARAKAEEEATPAPASSPSLEAYEKSVVCQRLRLGA